MQKSLKLIFWAMLVLTLRIPTSLMGMEPVVNSAQKSETAIDVAMPKKLELGETPLHEAARRGCAKDIGILIAAGAKVDAADHWGLTPLHEAASHGHAECVTKLIVAGANVEAKNNDTKSTALFYAANYGNADCVVALIEAGAEVDFKNAIGITALYYAVMNSHADCAQILVNYYIKKQIPIDSRSNWVKNRLLELNVNTTDVIWVDHIV